MGKSKKVVWEVLKLEYVHDPRISMRKLAENHGVNFSTLTKRAKKEKWGKARLEFLEELCSKFRQKALLTLTSMAETSVRGSLESAQQVREKLIEIVLDQLGNGAPQVLGDTVVEDTRGPGGKRIRRALQRHKITVNDPVIRTLLEHEREMVRLLLGQHARMDVRHHIHVSEVKDIVEQLFEIICEEVEDDDVRRRVAGKLQQLSLGAGGSAGQLPPSDTLAIHARVVEGDAA